MKGGTAEALAAAAFRNTQLAAATAGAASAAAGAVNGLNNQSIIAPSLQQLQQQQPQQQGAGTAAATQPQQQQQGPPATKEGMERKRLPFAKKEHGWQAEQGPAGWHRSPRQVPEEVNIIMYPDRGSCNQVLARGSRRMVWCIDPNCVKHMG